MGRHPKGETPVKRRGTNSHASKAKKAKATREEFDQANIRYQAAKYYLENMSRESFRGALPYIRQAMKDGDLPGNPEEDVPSHVTLWRWVQKYEEVQAKDRAPGVFDFLANNRAGRNRKPLDPWVENWLHDEVLQGRIRSLPRLHKAAVKAAKDNGWPPPTKWQVRRYVEEFPIADLSAARHGRRASLIDAMPALTIPTDRPHEVWMLDETRAPLYIRTLNPKTKEWVPARPWIILLMDVFSRAILSYWVVDPFRYGTDGSYRSREILGTLLSGALPDLAPESTESFAGYLPEELRWDKHGSHETLVHELRQYGIDVQEAVGRMPNRQGRVEKLNKTVKGLCETIVGAEHVYRPVHEKTMSENPKKARTRQAGRTDRIHRKRPIHVEDLLKIDEFREEFGERVTEYNNHEHSFLNGMTPEIAYLRGLEKEKTRSGWDALLFMENKVLTCTKAGVDHTEAGKRVRFAAESVGLELKVGENVECFCDPLQRRLFVDHDDGFAALMPVEEWARQVDVEGTIRRRKRQTAEASDYADEARQRKLDQEVGAGASERADAAMKEQLDEDDREEGVPPRREGLVAHTRAKARKKRREGATRPDRPGATTIDLEVDDDGRTRRRRGMASDPMDEVQIKEDAS